MKIQSYSDIITNSSSEIFIFKSDICFDEMKAMIDTHYEKHYVAFPPDGDFTCNTCSGVGGDHDISEIDKDECNCWDLDEDYSNTDKHIYKVHIDWNSYATIDWLLDTFNDSINRVD